MTLVNKGKCFNSTYHYSTLMYKTIEMTKIPDWLLIVLNAIPDIDTYYDQVDALEEQGMATIIQRSVTKQKVK